MTKRILVLTTEPLPYPGLETTGAGLRAWGLAEGLKSRGFEVIAAMPEQSIPEGKSLTFAQLKKYCFNRNKIKDYIKSVNPDAILLQHWGMFRDIGEVDCPLAIDLAGPHLLERKYWGSKDFNGDLAEKLAALRAADYLVCSGEIQRKYFLPFLMFAGWDINENSLPVIPFSISGKTIKRDFQNKDLKAFIYSGRFLPWQNPEKPIRWLLEVFKEERKGKLIIYGGEHPFGDVSGGKFQPLLEKIKNNPYVELRGTLPFDDLLQEISGCDIALDLFAKNPERELAFTSRTMTYFWCGVPVIYNNYSEISEIIKKNNCGWCMDPDNEQEFKTLIRKILNDNEEIKEKSEACISISEEYSWDKTISPLVKFFENPAQRDNKLKSLTEFEYRERKISETEEKYRLIESELMTIKGKRSVRWILRLFSTTTLFSTGIFVILFPVILIILIILIISDSIYKQ